MISSHLDQAYQLDKNDSLAHFRSRFLISDPSHIYMDGNSLGRLPLETSKRLQTVVQQEWGQRLIRSWNEGWLEAAEHIGDKVAMLIGASPGEVLVADSTSVNLYKLAVAAMLAQPGRHKIVTDDLNFPSDVYILNSVCKLLGNQCQVEIIPSEDGIYGPEEQLMKAMDENTTLVSLSHTTFKSGYTYDMQNLTEAAHQSGALILWDLSHSVGVMPISLNAINADLAIGCTYKYLNGGPGAPAFLYVRKDHQKLLNNPLPGWMGHRDSFAFGLEYKPAPNIRRFMTGTPPIISLSAVEPGLDLLLEAGIENVRVKSLQLTSYLLDLWQQLLVPFGFRLQSPIEEKWRGSHISLGHNEGHSIDLALIHERNVIPDFREPDNIRLGLSPLYTSFADVFTAVSRLQSVVEDNIYKKYKPVAGSVT